MHTHTQTRWTLIHPRCQTARFPEGIPGIPGTIFLIPEGLVLCSSRLDPQPRNTLTHRQSNKPRYPLGRAEFTSWLSYRECCCNPGPRVMNSIVDAELANTREYHRGNTICTICSGEMRQKEREREREREKQITCWKVAPHLTRIHAANMRGGLSSQLQLPSCHSQVNFSTRRVNWGSTLHRV